MTDPAPAATLVIFGALGDLSRRLLAPALFHLQQGGLLDPAFRIVGIGRDDGDDAMLGNRLAEFVGDDSASDEWHALAGRLSYVRGDFDDPALFATLKGRIDGNAVFYFATDPAFFAPLVDRLADAGLLDEADGFRRVAIEKPFGHDHASAQALDAGILKRMNETQVYRVDHFLGKETVQNLLVARFANSIVEALWDTGRIDHIQITAAEVVDVGTRGKFYDSTGALRDMVPNHLFSLLALMAMDVPSGLEADAIRDAKVAVLAAIKPVGVDDAVRGQYAAGNAGGKAICDYHAERDVAPGSTTETFVALKVELELPRWRGVPFYLRTGKALAARDTEIVVTFRPPAHGLFDAATTACGPNRLIFQIQPQEGLTLGIVAKQPGMTIETATIDLSFRYADRFKLGRVTGYETLFYELLVGDQTLFQRADMIEAGWAAVQSLIEAWRSGEPDSYVAGTSGPATADALLARDGRTWHALE